MIHSLIKYPILLQMAERQISQDMGLLGAIEYYKVRDRAATVLLMIISVWGPALQQTDSQGFKGISSRGATPIWKCQM